VTLAEGGRRRRGQRELTTDRLSAMLRRNDPEVSMPLPRLLALPLLVALVSPTLAQAQEVDLRHRVTREGPELDARR